MVATVGTIFCFIYAGFKCIYTFDFEKEQFSESELELLKTSFLVTVFIWRVEKGDSGSSGNGEKPNVPHWETLSLHKTEYNQFVIFVVRIL